MKHAKVKRRIVAAATGVMCILGVQLITAAPAAGDHVFAFDDAGCSLGTFESPAGIDLSTAHASVRVKKDGSVRVSCHFRGLPASVTAGDEYGDPVRDWVRPTTKTAVAVNFLSQYGESGFGRCSGQMTFERNGSANVKCFYSPLS